MRVRHALSGAIYRTLEDGLVEIEHGGRLGVFRTNLRHFHALLERFLDA